MLQLWSSDPARGIKVKFDDSGPYFNWGPTGESFKEGFMGFPNQAQALEGISKVPLLTRVETLCWVRIGLRIPTKIM